MPQSPIASIALWTPACSAPGERSRPRRVEESSPTGGASAVLPAEARAIITAMGVRAVLFDVGGVLERVGPPEWSEAWRLRLGLTVEEWEAAVSRIDPGGGAVTGASPRLRCAPPK